MAARIRRAPILIPLHSLWRFRETDRVANALWLKSSAKHDTIEFRFDGETSTRRAKVRSFLEHFVRVP